MQGHLVSGDIPCHKDVGISLLFDTANGSFHSWADSYSNTTCALDLTGLACFFYSLSLRQYLID